MRSPSYNEYMRKYQAKLRAADPAANRAYQRERYAARHRKLTVADWAAKLAGIESPAIRARAAGIVWWDQCEGKGWPDLREFCPDFEKYRGVEVRPDDLISALKMMGYKVKMAKKRGATPHESY